VPPNFVLGRTRRDKTLSTRHQIALVSAEGQSFQEITIPFKSKITHTEQMNLMALLPIFKILFQIQKNNEDESYRNLIS
jgi:hypothetical protein